MLRIAKLKVNMSRYCSYKCIDSSMSLVLEAAVLATTIPAFYDLRALRILFPQTYCMAADDQASRCQATTENFQLRGDMNTGTYTSKAGKAILGMHTISVGFRETAIKAEH